jgi:hypothetical protein
MRLDLAGTLVRPEPITVKYVADGSFVPATFIEQGYTDFDVICIGGGGGMGGGIDTVNTGTQIRSFGGAGGGGGLHRVQGLLVALPETCPVVVGAGGVPGTEHNSNPALTTDGTDGEYSSFNDTTCQASGGKGGKRVQSNSQTVTTQANGGEGGIGNRLISGGGASGGLAGTPSATGPGTPGSSASDGSWNGSIGAGGGGGAGGVGKYGSGGVTLNAATSGGRGSYNLSDTSVYGPLGVPTKDIVGSGAENVMPGEGGGAKAAPLTGLPTVFGQSNGKLLPSDPGVVIIRLTAV